MLCAAMKASLCGSEVKRLISGRPGSGAEGILKGAREGWQLGFEQDQARARGEVEGSDEGNGVARGEDGDYSREYMCVCVWMSTMGVCVVGEAIMGAM